MITGGRKDLIYVSHKKERPINEVNRAYTFLRDQTINFGFPPGERINEVKLASGLKMSRAPIREALNRLSVTGLVRFEPGKGFFCRRLSVNEVSELFEVRSDLELSAIEKICINAANKDIHDLYKKWLAIEKNESTLSVDSLVDIDESFHMGLLRLANNNERINFMKNINERIRFVRQINLETNSRRKKFINEHTQIMEAIVNRDSKQAISLMNYHLGVNSQELKSNIREGLSRIYSRNIGLD